MDKWDIPYVYHLLKRENMRKLIALMILSVFAFCEADAQGILKRLKDKAVETVTNKAEEKVQKTVSDEMDDVLGNEDESEGKKSKKSKKGGGEEEVESAPATPEAAEATYAKSDFVPGDEVFFADELAGEKLGEFPSQWDLLEGSAEVAVMKGQNCIHFLRDMEECRKNDPNYGVSNQETLRAFWKSLTGQTVPD